ncbi:tRNA (guanosine(46)-N7)-methyltransferase TrmB [Mycoplasmoides alvi]|uniref:tRNA (guanosine(46)-N7)-methyltransferase TrmB n=1 Tax=Mycoplasmoides alvi TaxID=78580 RepID=UPI00051B94EA|nr:tRNA (guanosine(46)-N7)-methyltransferase TrmB [Mycoplasmoides alvi]
MRLRHDPNAINNCLSSKYFKKIDSFKANDISLIFKNKNKKYYLEIGSGKGVFLLENAKNNLDVNYIGLEKFSTVISKAIKKYEQQKQELNNIYLTCGDANNLENYFPKHFFQKLFLNFSDPWPKKRHSKRRLVDMLFLKKYKQILIPNGIIEFKTDNSNLFQYCLEQIEMIKDIKIVDKTWDLYSLEPNSFLRKNNIQTEYEKKFLNAGGKIKKIIFTFFEVY